MSKTLKISIVLIISISILLLCGNIVRAEVYSNTGDDFNCYELNGVLRIGEEVNKRFIDHQEGTEYMLDNSELPNGLSLTNDGRIVGTVDTEQDSTQYYVDILVSRNNEVIAGYYYEITIISANEIEEWVNFDNLYMEEATITEAYGDDEIYTKDGIVVYNETLAKYISYNASTKTYNIAYTQDFQSEMPGNYVEMLFKESEKDKLVKFEIVENEGFIPFEPYILAIANYEYYTEDDEDLYSAYIMAQVKKSYTGTNRHLKIKVTNVNDSTQYRYLNFTILDSNKLFVVYETNGGSNINPIQKEIGDKLTLPTPPTKEGWSFDGWFTDEELQTPFDVNTEITRNVVLFAKWKNDYKFTEGQKQEYDIEKGGSIKFRINAKLELLDKVLVDGEEIDTTKYKKESGSTIITLLEDYVKTLNVGKHTIKVTYTDGYVAESEFSIIKGTEEKDDTPKTGISNNASYVAIIGTVSVIGILVSKKRI